MNSATIYPSKILIAGEYTVLSGYSGLAIPHMEKFAQWKMDLNSENKIFNKLHQFISESTLLSSYINMEAFTNEISNGLYLDSSIPYGYGLGSSGTLCAAILDRFGKHLPLQTEALFALLKELEHFFHGQSSGVDPAVAYFKKPIYIENNQIQILSFNSEDFLKIHRIHLLDSHVGRNTESLVEVFKQKLKNESFKHILTEELVPANKNLIDAIVLNDEVAISHHWKQVSRKSFTIFEELIPETIKSYWEKGMETGTHYCKLCGAGGGGYFLVKETKEAF